MHIRHVCKCCVKTHDTIQVPGEGIWVEQAENGAENMESCARSIMIIHEQATNDWTRKTQESLPGL